MRVALEHALKCVKITARAPAQIPADKFAQAAQAAEDVLRDALVVQDPAAAVVLERALDVKPAADVQAAVMAVGQDATRDVRAHARRLALGSVLAHVFRRVPVNLQLKF